MVGTKPSKVAARLSLADWLLVVRLGTATSVPSSTVAITDATVESSITGSKSVDHRGHGACSTLDTLSRPGGIKNVDGYFYVISSKRLCDDGLVGWNEGTLGMCWAMTEFESTAVAAEGRSAEG